MSNKNNFGMNIYKCEVIIKSIDYFTQYIVAPSKIVVLDKEWINSARENSDFGDPDKESEDMLIKGVKKINKFEDVEPNWATSLPWYHPDYPPVDLNCEMKDYFKTHDIKYSLIRSINRNIENLEYDIKSKQLYIDSLKKEINSIKNDKIRI